jgi:hypothetical protein
LNFGGLAPALAEAVRPAARCRPVKAPAYTMCLTRIRQEIVSCNRCARLRTYCARIAREKKAAHRGDV